MNDTSTSPKQQTIQKWLGTGSVNFFGMPFAGKDTQGKRLAKRFEGVFISGGDILRHLNLPVPDKLALDRGDMLPVKDYLHLILPYLSRLELEGKPLVLSAIGHRSGESAAILDATTKAGHPTKAVIYLHIDESTAVARWHHLASQDDRHRRDDQPGILEHRFGEYRSKTLPVLDFYRERGLLVEVDGSGTPDEVEANIFESLCKKAFSEN